MTVGIDEKGNIIEIYGLSTSSGGGGGTGIEYTAKNPISITDNKIGLKIDNQTLQTNENGQLVANLDELGNEVNTIANNLTKKQDILVDGVNIKTINGQPITGAGNITIEGGSGGGSEWVGSYKMMLEGTQAGSFEINLADVLTENSQYEILMRAYLNASNTSSQTNTYISSDVFESPRNCYVASTNTSNAKYATSVFTFPIGKSKKFTISCNVDAQKYQFEMFAYKKVG